MSRLAFSLTFSIAALLAAVSGATPAWADVVVLINKSTQRMTVFVDGVERHHWSISSGLGGGPPSGIYRPQRMERMWFSRRYDWSPMPHSIFFHKGYAIHGTQYVSRLGRRASHGCVRLHPANASVLFALVRRQGMGATRIFVTSGSIASATAPTPAVARGSSITR
jgi:lipoprotein-anchoring transpeptidase ErfK/SrfK